MYKHATIYWHHLTFNCIMKVSVCIATYNGELYIRQQIESILLQMGENDEIIVSDDGSTDATIKIVESLHDARIKIVSANGHNFKKNFENALLHATGDYIFLSDQDDVWLEGKYAKCLKELQTYDLVITNSRVVDNDMNIIITSFFDYYHSGPGVLKNSLNNTYFGACMAFNRKVLNFALPFPKTKEIGHDIWIGLVAEIIGKVHFINQPFLLYRRHDLSLTNISTNLAKRSQRKILTKLISRFIVLYHVGIFYTKHKL